MNLVTGRGPSGRPVTVVTRGDVPPDELMDALDELKVLTPLVARADAFLAPMVDNRWSDFPISRYTYDLSQILSAVTPLIGTIFPPAAPILGAAASVAGSAGLIPGTSSAVAQPPVIDPYRAIGKGIGWASLTPEQQQAMTAREEHVMKRRKGNRAERRERKARRFAASLDPQDPEIFAKLGLEARVRNAVREAELAKEQEAEEAIANAIEETEAAAGAEAEAMVEEYEAEAQEEIRELEAEIKEMEKALRVSPSDGARQALDLVHDLNILPALRTVARARGQSVKRKATRCDACLADSPEFYGELPVGTFFESEQLTGEIASSIGPRGETVYGMIDLGNMPFRIQISADHGSGRARIALWHEIVHAADKILKIGMSHDKTHALGVWLASEGYPAMRAFEQFAGV